MIANTDYVSSWKSKGLSAETIKPPTKSDNSLISALNCYGSKTRLKSIGSCLQQPKVSHTHGSIVNIYIIYKLGASSSHPDDPTLKNCLFGAVTLTKTLILISTVILFMELDSIEKQLFHFQVVNLVKM